MQIKTAAEIVASLSPENHYTVAMNLREGTVNVFEISTTVAGERDTVGVSHETFRVATDYYEDACSQTNYQVFDESVAAFIAGKLREYTKIKHCVELDDDRNVLTAWQRSRCFDELVHIRKTLADAYNILTDIDQLHDGFIEF